jgi:uridylate kinase
MKKKRIVLKLSGTILQQKEQEGTFCADMVRAIGHQLKKISDTHQCTLVIGGGNIWRGATHTQKFNLEPHIGHSIGMLATVINGLILTDILNQEGVPAVHLSAIECAGVVDRSSYDALRRAQQDNILVVFSAGTGIPYFTTDTAAIIRAIEWGADEVWKGTNVAGVFTTDPRTDKNAQFRPSISFTEAIAQRLGIMDTTAYTLADQHGIAIRVFDIFEPNVLEKVATDSCFGSLIFKEE